MGKLTYHIGKPTEDEQVLLDFRDGLARSVDDRISLGLIPLALPVINDVPYRVFESLECYRAWADRELPRYLGYARS